MNERRYIAACRGIKKEADAKLDAMAQAWRILHGTEPPSIGQKKPRNRDINDCAVNGVVAQVVAEMGDEFNTRDVYLIVRKFHRSADRTAVTHALKRMCGEDGPIELIATGTGKRPSTYRKKPAFVDLSAI